MVSLYSKKVQSASTFGILRPNMIRVSPLRRPANRANHVFCSIDVSAFAAIMLFFVVLFMNPGPIICGSRISTDMGKVSHATFMAAAEKEDAMIVSITRERKFFFGSEIVWPSDLPTKIHQSIGRGSERKVYIRADARAKYGWVKEVLDEVRASGVEKVGFLVDQRTAPTQTTKTLP